MESQTTALVCARPVLGRTVFSSQGHGQHHEAHDQVYESDGESTADLPIKASDGGMPTNARLGKALLRA